MTALELWELMRCLDALVARSEVDGGRVAMAGLSFGGYYTHFMAAVDTRIQVALCSCMLYDQPSAGWDETNWPGAARQFGFLELSALVCPRPFYLEAGKTDDLVPADRFPPHAQRLRALYECLGVADRFAFKIHGGWHEFDKADDGIDFVLAQLAIQSVRLGR